MSNEFYNDFLDIVHKVSGVAFNEVGRLAAQPSTVSGDFENISNLILGVQSLINIVKGGSVTPSTIATGISTVESVINDAVNIGAPAAATVATPAETVS